MCATHKKLSHEALVSYLRTVAFFADLDHGIIKELAHDLEWSVLEPGDVLLKQGDSSESMFIIYSGRMEVLIQQAAGDEVTVGSIGPGETAGEIQILTGGKRTATVQTVEKSEVLKLNKDTFETLISTNPDMLKTLAETVHKRNRRNVLIALLPDLIGTCSDSIVSAVEASSSWISLRKGEILFRQDDAGMDLYLLICGRLGVSRTRSSGIEEVIGEIARGEIVGEMAVFSGEPRYATVYAKRDSELLHFTNEAFRTIAERYPRILLHVTTNIIQRLRRVNTGSKRRDDVKKIAVVSLGRNVPTSEFTDRLIHAIKHSEPVLTMNSAFIDNELETPGISHLSDDDPNIMRLSAWLDERESNHRYIIYETDEIGSNWMKRCLNRADRILMVLDSAEKDLADIIENFKGQIADNTHIQDLILILLHATRSIRPQGTNLLLDTLNVKAHFHIDWSSSSDFERLARYLTGKTIGLVLGGGGARGYAHIGVLRALNEAGILVDVVGGTSMGAIIASHIALGDEPEEIVRLHKELHSKDRPYKEYTLPVFSVLGGRRLNRVMERYSGNVMIEDLWMPFFCVSTDISTADRVIHRRGPLWRAVRASLSIPGIFPPVIEDEHLLVDGCLLNNLPGDIMRDLYGGLVMLVNVTPKQDLLISDSISDMPSPMKYIMNRLRRGEEAIDIPTILTLMIRSSMVSSIKKSREIIREADYYIDPPVSKFGLTDYDSIDEIVDVGYRYAQTKIEEWRNMERFREIEG